MSSFSGAVKIFFEGKMAQPSLPQKNWLICHGPYQGAAEPNPA